MKNILYRDEIERDRFFHFVELRDNTKGHQITKFFHWAFDHGYFENVGDDDIYYCYECGRLVLPLLKNNKITIGVIIPNATSAEIGLDPSACFNKTHTCSVFAVLPITSKREEEKFYRLLDSLSDKGSVLRKSWMKTAQKDWYGSFAKFN